MLKTRGPPRGGESDSYASSFGTNDNEGQEREEARVALHGHVPEAPLPQGSRPPCLGESRGPQDKVQQRIIEQLADDVPTLTLLDSPVPQMVDQLVAVLARYDTPIREQVVEVPKISCPPRFSRTVHRRPQMTEQLVEVPTLLSYATLQQWNAKQTIDIPVSSRRRGQGGLQGSHQDRVRQRRLWSRSSTSPFVEAFQGFFSKPGIVAAHCGAARGHSSSWWWPSCPAP